MSAHIPIEALEALAAGEATEAQRGAVEAHLATCAECQEELRWLETERALFSRRQQEAPVEVAPLWVGVNDRLDRRRRSRGQAVLLGTALAGAAAVTVLLLWSGGARDAGGPPAIAADDLAPPARLTADQGAPPLERDIDPSDTPDHSTPHLPTPPEDQDNEPDLDPADRDLPASPADDAAHEIAAPADGDAVAAATTTHPVSGPVALSISGATGTITVRGGARDRIVLDAGGAGHADIATDGKGLVVTLDGRRNLGRASIQVEVPRNSTLTLRTASGDIRVQDVRGDLELATASGDLAIEGVRDVIASTASGDLRITGATGAVRARTMSGTAVIQTTARPATRVALSSVSGDLRWTGACGDGCELALDTVSGDAHLAFTARSSFRLVHSSFSGRLRDRLGLTTDTAPPTFGAGAGLVRASSVSGDLDLRPAGR